jgi:hypothetical protein
MRTLLISILLIIFYLITLLGCTKNENVKTIYYSWQTKEDTIPYIFIATKIFEHNNLRKVISYEYNVHQNRIFDTIVDFYRITNNKLYKRSYEKDLFGECILSITKDTCVEYNYSDKKAHYYDFSKYCFLGDTVINNTSASKFYIKTGRGDWLFCNVYLDKFFIIIQQDYVKGNGPDFIMRRTEKAPQHLVNLIENK